MPDREDGLLGSRNVKLNRLRERGIDPYPPRFTRSSDAARAIADFEANEPVSDSDNPPENAAPESLTGSFANVN